METNLIRKIIKGLGVKFIAMDNIFLGKEDCFFIVRTDKGYLSVRVAKDEQKILTEKAIIRLCKKHGIPVPQIILYKKVGDMFFLIEKVNGEPLTSKSLHIYDYNKVLTSLAQVLLILHKIELKGFGFFNDDLVGRIKTWQKFITENLDKELIFLQNKRILPKLFIKKISHFLHFESTNILPVLLHGNLMKKALFVDKKLRVSLTGFNHALIGDPNWDLAGFLLYENFDHTKRLINLYYLLGGMVQWDSEDFLKTALRRAIVILVWRVRKQRGNTAKLVRVVRELYGRLSLF